MQGTLINWADRVSQPVYAMDGEKRGWACVRCSPGCDHCYSERLNVFRGTGLPYDAGSWAKIKLALNEAELKKIATYYPRRWTLDRRPLCFLADMTDWTLWSDDMVSAVHAAVADNHRMDFVLLTKRPERISQFFEPIDAMGNLILGLTACSQEEADAKIPIFLKAARGFRTLLCVEPMLGPVRVERDWLTGVSWVIAGPETGPGARPCRWEWIEDLREQCKAAGVPFWLKACPNDPGVVPPRIDNWQERPR
jgi:protein gp37